jgi:ribosomal protein S18 acetylase RimI-like enzyme
MNYLPSSEHQISYRVNPDIDNETLNLLFSLAWPEHEECDFGRELAHALCYVCAYQIERLVGFGRLAWDGGIHAFLLDPTVDPAFRRRGIGRELVRLCVAEAEARHIEWIHVDFEPSLCDFYGACGFRPTDAGVLQLERVGRRTVP